MTTTLNTPGVAEEGFVDIDGEGFYVIPDIDLLGPFLMSILSDGDHWMFVSSRGGLTAGRGSAAAALFPYETDDRLHFLNGVTGPVTLVRRRGAAGDALWEPFAQMARPGVRRNLYKSVVGNQVIFEEINEELGLAFRYRWANSDRFGFVRTASIVNIGDRPTAIELLDGVLNLLPAGLEPATYRTMGNLANAYKRSELADPDARLAVFSLESLIVDVAEPAEALKASVAWSVGLDDARVTVDSAAIRQFRVGDEVVPGHLVTGRAGAYLLVSHLELEPGTEVSWTIVADVGQDQAQVVELREFLRSATDPRADAAASVARGTESLIAMMASADALQRTGDRMATAHHFANVAFNSMRGGVFVSGTQIDTRDLAAFLTSRNREVAALHHEWLKSLPGSIDRADMLEHVLASGDPQLIRLALEYLPLTFSRRHGDPSRPWNVFSIRVRDDEGRPIVHYEGNWRDIFQNWEALSMSFPSYLPSIISVFLNASTADGFNPYRITRDGIDWETPEPGNPWSNIGYWGDHQIVYLLRILEMAQRYLPGVLDDMLGREWFAYADVPYRLAPYDEIVRDPRATITYDLAAAEDADRRVAAIGRDGKLLPGRDGSVGLVTMIEKLLVPALSKLSNLVPGGGIWMNTQRPEWNDANNALVGNGLSVVTACYLRRYLELVSSLLEDTDIQEVRISVEVAEWLLAVSAILQESSHHQSGNLGDERRRDTIDRLGRAFGDYRARVYSAGFSGTATVETTTIRTLIGAAIDQLDDTIRGNLRPDGLYHSYNLLHLSADGSKAAVEHLDAMLEGQVAVLSSGLLPPDERVAVVDALFASPMYRADQNTFMLYPPRYPVPFLDKNVVPQSEVTANPLLSGLVTAGEPSIIEVDCEGHCRFSAEFKSERDLAAALDRLGEDVKWRDLVVRHRSGVLNVYEKVFNHHAYTGRSGSMYAYEGIGSIYWHMVAKLLVAVQESIREAKAGGSAPESISRLVDCYWRVRSGLGFEKTATEFGAFPTDPYSHTPAHAGAQQPGMTGQVKEEILTRLLELGVRVEGGEISFDPTLLRRAEFLPAAEAWIVRSSDGTQREFELTPGSLGMTVCQVPVIISLTDGEAHVKVGRTDGSHYDSGRLNLDRATSAAIFERTGDVAEVRVSIPSTALSD